MIYSINLLPFLIIPTIISQFP